MTRSLRLLPLAAVAFTVGCGAKVDFTPPRPTSVSEGRNPLKMTPSDLSQFVSTKAAIAGAESAVSQTQLPTEPLPKVTRDQIGRKTPQVVVGTMPPVTIPAMTMVLDTRPYASSTAVISMPRVRSEAPRETEADARSDALRVAGQKIVYKLQSLDSPIVISSLSTGRVWNEFVNKETARIVPLTSDEAAALGQSKAGANRMYYEVDVEIKEEQLLELRSESRLMKLAPFGGVFLIAAGVLGTVLRVGAGKAA